MKNRLTALLTTYMMLATAAPLPAQAVTDTLFGELPDWVPTNFVEAMEFYNDFGKSRVSGDIICLVRPMRTWQKDMCGFDISGGMTEINTPCSSEPKFYELDIPEKPDPEDAEAVAAYEAYCDRLGLRSYDYSFFERYAESRTQDAFEVELFYVADGYDLDVTWYEMQGDDKVTTEKFEFVNVYSYPEEVDVYRWLPDSKSEYDTYLKQNGRASVHGNYIVFLADINGSTGASLKMEQSGTGKIEEIKQSYCNPVAMDYVDGGSSHSAILYQVTADGYVNVDWTIGREWDDTPPEEQIKGNYKIINNCANIIELSKGTIFTLVDADTGKLIEIPDDAENNYILKCVNDKYKYCQFYDVKSNPCQVDDYSQTDDYYFHLFQASGWYESAGITVTSETKDRVDVTLKLRWIPDGDINKDRAFDMTDAIIMNNWLHGNATTIMNNLQTVDFFHDGKVDARDLSRMKQKLLNKAPHLVLPEYPVRYGAPFVVVADELNLYYGPGEEYEVITTLPERARASEIGYQERDGKWLFTLYEGKYGWIKTVEDDGETPTIYFDLLADKPVIYLYPEAETDVHIKLELTEADLATTYPKYNDGWDVTAYPDGTLLNKADGTHHRYLFWDADNCRMHYDFSKGFCVAGSDTEQFLKDTLTYMGLTENEMNEFIVYWLPRMEHNAYNLITFQDEAYTDSAKLNITPEPDSLLRVFMAYVPLEGAVEIEPQQLETFERTGFTVVEWGGSEIGS